MKGICDMEKIESIINDVVRNYELDCEKVDDIAVDFCFFGNYCNVFERRLFLC